MNKQQPVNAAADTGFRYVVRNAKETKRAVKPRASRLAESSRGRASRSRLKSDVVTEP